MIPKTVNHRVTEGTEQNKLISCIMIEFTRFATDTFILNYYLIVFMNAIIIVSMYISRVHKHREYEGK